MYYFKCRIMRFAFILVSVLICTQISIAQFSVSAKYSANTYPEWSDLVSQYSPEGGEFLGNGIEYGLAYWFRLKNKRVEFYPEVSYQKLTGTASSFLDEDVNYEVNALFFHLNTQFYTLDFDGDCNCPTFSKDGAMFSKGFFVGLSPGIAYLKEKITSPEFAQDGIDKTTIAPSLGAYIGLDVGINDLITISPFLRINTVLGANWEDFVQSSWGLQPNPDEHSKIISIQPGLRIAIRPDYLREQRGWR